MIGVVIFFILIVVLVAMPMKRFVFGKGKVLSEIEEEKRAKRVLFSCFIALAVLIFGIPLFYPEFPSWTVGEEEWPNYESAFYGGLFFIGSLFAALMITSLQELSGIKTKRDIRLYINSTKEEKVTHVENSYKKLLELKKACAKEPIISIPILEEAITELESFLDENPNDNK
ncbi:hypothetical protein J7E38_16165 [Bacillus sp. ISL-35]|uniref:hypothetical protein n=1 Tax=Bacillus sp. ISL-35 TaxID=2819122 RepID=UPI001BE7052E|nr:hypothetical protein [Bacillus sp. ISL-35]MBT2680545.1 hypothetical protein [Bacillus sp. ISL-35]MBT2704161.1 hypothetical protein [Chryseobacterium sp. ISL-80]